MKKKSSSSSVGRKPRRKKAAAKALPKTKAFNGKNYKKSSCGSTKTAANKTASNARKKGKLARVIKDPKTGKHCVYVRGAARKASTRRK